MSHFCFVPTVELDQEAMTQLQQPSATDALQAILTTLDHQSLTAEQAQKMINQVVKNSFQRKVWCCDAIAGRFHGRDEWS